MKPCRAREWRQFRLLLRTSFGRLMDTAVASREIDASQFVIWSFALVATPVFFFAMQMMGKYSWLWRQPEVLQRVVTVDRLFFIVYMMLACALLAAVLWEALFPDRQDQEIVGVLPVRARTVAAARLTAALGVATVFAVAVAAPSAFMYMLNVGAAFRSVPIVGWAPAVLVAHIVAVVSAGVFTFAGLLALRGIAVVCLGAHVVQRAAIVLQLLTVVLLVESFIFLPGVLGALTLHPAVVANPSLFPPLWFLGLYGRLSGAAPHALDALAGLAVSATVLSVLAAAAGYTVPARWNARRTIEARATDRAGRAIAIAQWLAAPVLRSPVSRAVFGFVMASQARSRRHAFIVVTWFGVGISVAAIWLFRTMIKGRAVALDVPADDLVSIPLVLTFFLVLGLRSAFKVPTDLDANWTFRLAQPRSTAPILHGIAVAMVVLAVLPVTVVWFLVTASMWALRDAAATAVMHAASGVMLVELMLLKCDAVPFTRAHAPASSAVRAGWGVMFAALHFYAFKLEDLQLAAMNSAGGVIAYVGIVCAVVAATRLRRRMSTAHRLLEFEAPADPTTQTLNLSHATG
jgi:hypothetical protein